MLFLIVGVLLLLGVEALKYKTMMFKCKKKKNPEATFKRCICIIVICMIEAMCLVRGRMLVSLKPEASVINKNLSKSCHHHPKFKLQS